MFDTRKLLHEISRSTGNNVITYQRGRLEAFLVVEGRGLQNTDFWLPPFTSSTDRQKGARQIGNMIDLVNYLPLSKTPITADAEVSSTDSTERKSHGLQEVIFEDW